MRAALLAALLLVGCGEDEPPLPSMIAISDFTLVDQTGEEFSSRELRGHVWVANMIFTSCPDICPVMSSQMANLTRRVPHDDVRFVSISVDPEVDTPEVLSEYAERFGADTERWIFLTGSSDDVNRVITRSFRSPVGDRVEMDEGYDILHSSRFMLIDSRMTLRGLYDRDREGLEQLERDIERLREEP